MMWDTENEVPETTGVKIWCSRICKKWVGNGGSRTQGEKPEGIFEDPQRAMCWELEPQEKNGGPPKKFPGNQGHRDGPETGLLQPPVNSWSDHGQKPALSGQPGACCEPL